MPPKWKDQTTRGVTKWQTRLDIKKAANLAVRNTELVQTLSRQAVIQNKNTPVTENTVPTPTQTRNNNTQQKVELTTLVTSLNNEIAKLRVCQADLEQELAGTSISQDITPSSSKGKEVDRAIGQQDLHELLMNTLSSLSNNQPQQEGEPELKEVEVMQEELQQLAKARSTFRPFNYIGKEANQYW